MNAINIIQWERLNVDLLASRRIRIDGNGKSARPRSFQQVRPASLFFFFSPLKAIPGHLLTMFTTHFDVFCFPNVHNGGCRHVQWICKTFLDVRLKEVIISNIGLHYVFSWNIELILHGQSGPISLPFLTFKNTLRYLVNHLYFDVQSVIKSNICNN